jgi:Fic family protein
VTDAAPHGLQPIAVYNGVAPTVQMPESESALGISPIGAPADETPRVSPPPERPLPTAESVEERYRIIEERLKEAPPEFRNNYQDAIDMSWIYHDSALEGVVYTFQELRAALDNDPSAITDSSLQPVVEEIRRHKSAIDLVRELGEKKRAPITVDVIKKIYLTLHPEEGDVKTVKYRRDIPQHRLYFHEYSHPEKIQIKVRQIVDWLNGPEPKKLKSPIRVASRAHYELLRVFPFQTDSGKVARLFMNLLLLRAGHPPAIVHSTERQRYYESLRGSLPSLIQMVTESILNALISIEKLLDEHDMKVSMKGAVP